MALFLSICSLKVVSRFSQASSSNIGQNPEASRAEQLFFDLFACKNPLHVDQGDA
jgi:hypothetical protein